jgi:hypothetical protein
MSQCDGCMRSMPLNERGHHITEDDMPDMACTAHLYTMSDDEIDVAVAVHLNEVYAREPMTEQEMMDEAWFLHLDQLEPTE